MDSARLTDVALKEYFERQLENLDRRIDQRLIDMDRRNEQRFKSGDVALDKADMALREYKIGSNEWRDALNDANARMATKVEMDKIDEAVRDLQRAKANLDGRLLMLSGSISVVVTVALWLVTRLLH